MLQSSSWRGSPWSGGGFSLPGGFSLVPGESAWSGGVSLVPGGLPGLGGGFSLVGGFSLLGGVVSPWSQGGFSRDPPCVQNHRHV